MLPTTAPTDSSEIVVPVPTPKQRHSDRADDEENGENGGRIRRQTGDDLTEREAVVGRLEGRGEQGYRVHMRNPHPVRGAVES